jgi:hypothetical protein
LISPRPKEKKTKDKTRFRVLYPLTFTCKQSNLQIEIKNGKRLTETASPSQQPAITSFLQLRQLQPIA